jgi:hypothetical protein
MKNTLQELGEKLVEDAVLNEEFSFERGVINELFPYIYKASKHMSCRGISRWLEANGTKLSVSTIAKALRNPEPYWQEIYEEIQPAALIFSRAHNVDEEDMLKSHDLFFLLRDRPPIIEGLTSETVGNLLSEYEAACVKLREDWFSMPAEIIEICLSNLPDEKASAKDVEKSKDEAA